MVLTYVAVAQIIIIKTFGRLNFNLLAYVMELIYEVAGIVHLILACSYRFSHFLPQIFIDKVATRLYIDS